MEWKNGMEEEEEEIRRKLKERESLLSPMPNNDEIYKAAIHDMCARFDILEGILINAAAEAHNTKNHYLKMLGQMRQEKEIGS